jgi:hypothetical protein
MKNLFLLTSIAIFLIVAIAAYAAPTGKLVVDPNGNAIQEHSPYPPSSDCTTTTTTKGTIKYVTVSGYSKLCWDARDASHAAATVKRHLGSNTAYMPTQKDCIALNKDMSTVVFKPYSGASAAYTVCTELTRGGVTP